MCKSAPGLWPEAGPFPQETLGQSAWAAFRFWALGTLFVVVIFACMATLTAGASMLVKFVLPAAFVAVGLAFFSLWDFAARRRG